MTWRERIREAASYFRPERSMPFGVTAIVRVRNEADWVSLSIRSLRGFADQVIVGDNGSDDGSPERVEELRREFPGWIEVVDGKGDDIKTLTNRLADRAAFRWIVRWDADFVAHTDGPRSMQKLRDWLKTLPRRHFLIYLRMDELAGDLFHQDPRTRQRSDAHLFTRSAGLAYVYDPKGFESPRAPLWYAVRRWDLPCFVHLHVKSDRRLFWNHLWKRNPSLPVPEDPSPEEAARWKREMTARLAPVGEGFLYPALLRDELKNPRHRLAPSGEKGGTA